MYIRTGSSRISSRASSSSSGCPARAWPARPPPGPRFQRPAAQFGQHFIQFVRRKAFGQDVVDVVVGDVTVFLRQMEQSLDGFGQVHPGQPKTGLGHGASCRRGHRRRRHGSLAGPRRRLGMRLLHRFLVGRSFAGGFRRRGLLGSVGAASLGIRLLRRFAGFPFQHNKIIRADIVRPKSICGHSQARQPTPIPFGVPTSETSRTPNSATLAWRPCNRSMQMRFSSRVVLVCLPCRLSTRPRSSLTPDKRAWYINELKSSI